jgi:hypothetical protein
VGGVTHTDVAAYVLGVLDKGENSAFEAHLLECPHCQFDLLEFYDLPEILDEIRQYWPAPPMPVPRELVTLLDQVAVRRRRRRLLTRVASVAAAVLIAAGPPITLALLPSPTVEGSASPQAAAPAGEVWRTGVSTNTVSPASGTAGSGTQGVQGVQATVVVHPTSWGSDITLELAGVPGPKQCQLFAISWTGEAQVVSTWMAPAPEDPAHPLRVSGGTAFAPDQIQKFEVRGDDGTVVTTIAH